MASTAMRRPGLDGGGWEVRPSGMVVQLREAATGGTLPPPPPVIKVRVKYGGARHDVAVSPVATFGELKKLLAARTGLKPADQKLMQNGKERSNSEYLNVCRIKNRSKLALVEDPASLLRRHIERQKSAKFEAANRIVGAVASEVDKLAHQLTTIEKSIYKGSEVAEVEITTLIELLMWQAVKLESIPAQGDACTNKNTQAKRVQKCVKTLDALRISNARLRSVITTTSWETFDTPAMTTQWEIFD